MLKSITRLLVASAALACLGGAWAQPLPEGMQPQMTLEDALARMARYESGQSRLPISIVSDHIVKLTNEGDKKAIRQFSYTLVGYLNAYWATVEGKREIMREVAKVGGSEAVPALEAAVKDKDLWDAALLAMEDIPSRDADDALRRLLDTTEGRARLGVIQTLGLRGDPASVVRLASIQKQDGDAATRSAAARALARLGGNTARRALLAALEDSTGALHRDVADAVLALAQSMAKSGDAGAAYRIFERLHDPAESAPIRGAALTGMLSTADGGRADSLWVEAIHGEPDARRVAVQAMTTLSGRNSTAVMAGELPKLAPDLQAYVARGLAARGDAAARAAVQAVAQSGAPEARPAALEALAVLGDSASVPVLVEALGSEDKAAASAARASLDRQRGDDVNSAMLAALHSAAPGVRAQLCASLAARNAFIAAPDLLILAERDPEADVRAAAFAALGEVALRIDVPALLRLLEGVKTDKERDAAEESIVDICRRSEDTSARVQPVQAAWSGAAGAYRVSLARILGRLQGQQAQATLIAALSDSDGDVSTAALRGLADWNDPGPRDTLHKIAASDAAAGRKVLALRGYIRQSGMDARDHPEAAVGRLREAMQLAGRDEERRMALAELGEISDIAAVRALAAYADAGSLQEEAMSAAVDIMPSIAAGHREEVIPLLEKYAPRLSNQDQRRAARSLLAQLRGGESFLTRWRVAGPFRQEGKSAVGLIEQPFAPETGGTVDWQRLRVGSYEDMPGYVSLLRLGGELPRVAYLTIDVQSPRAREVTLAVGSDDGVKIWLNGQVVHTAPALRSAVADQDKVNVRLQPGKNTLMLKVSDNGGAWGAYCRFLDADGRPIADLAAAPER